NVSPAACCRAAVLPIVRRAVIPVVAVVWGGVVTPVVGVDVGKLRPPEIGATIGIAEPSLWPAFETPGTYRSAASVGTARIAPNIIVRMPSRALRVLRIVLSIGFSRPCVAQGLPDRTRLAVIPL